VLAVFANFFLSLGKAEPAFFSPDPPISMLTSSFQQITPVFAEELAICLYRDQDQYNKKRRKRQQLGKQFRAET
jgi:hypothetical protein